MKVPPGYKLVPIEPTREMIDAANKAIRWYEQDATSRAVYAAAINAAPDVDISEVVEPVRVYDYVWPQRPEHKDDCIYACSYTPGHHLERGELLAVVDPQQLPSSYLQRE